MFVLAVNIHWLVKGRFISISDVIIHISDDLTTVWPDWAFWKVLATNILSKLAQIFSDFVCYMETTVAAFWANLKKNWTSFYLNICSHCLRINYFQCVVTYLREILISILRHELNLPRYLNGMSFQRWNHWYQRPQRFQN